MKRLGLFLSVILLALALSATTALATPWPDNGSINPLARTFTLEYGQAPYTHAAVKSIPAGGYIDFTLGGSTERITTVDRANAVLKAPRKSNAAFRGVIPYKGLDISGQLHVRHGLKLYRPSKYATRYIARGKVQPAKHYVHVSLQKKYLGVWITRQSTIVLADKYGNFSAVFQGRYSSACRVRAFVRGDTYNANKTAYYVY